MARRMDRRRNVPSDPNLNPEQLPLRKAWVSLENIAAFAKQAIVNIAASDADVLGGDLDGNYLYFTEALLGLLHPKLVIIRVPCQVSASRALVYQI